MSPIILGPSSIASQFWCEMAVDLRRKYGEVPTPEKEKGSEIHKDRFLEILEEVYVEIKTPADRLHSNIHNMITGLEQYQKDGLTRELPILFKFKSALIMGIIDEIREIKKIENQGNKKNEHMQVVEIKTRKSMSLPSLQQIIRDKMQGMIYWYGLNAMINQETEMGDFWTAYGVDLIESDFNEVVLSDEYMESLEIPKNARNEYGSLLSVGNTIDNALKNASKLPELSKTIEIIYIHQKTLEEIHREIYKFDKRFFKRGMNWALEYWLGKREPTSVGDSNGWKCNFCSYYNVCPSIHENLNTENSC